MRSHHCVSKRPALAAQDPTSSEINGLMKSGFPGTVGRSDPVSGPKMVEQGDKQGSDEGRCRRHLTTDMLSDDILLYIFDIYRQGSKEVDDIWPWHPLVHVSQRWRHVIFAFPHHLDLQLDCGPGTAMAKALGIWPANVLINIRSDLNFENGDDIIATLASGHRDRIVRIDMTCRTMPQLERCTAAMQEPFPVLRVLFLGCDENDGDAPVVIGALLGGSAPRLQAIELRRISFPTLPKLLLSTDDLTFLSLDEITSAGYISPDALATCLSMLKRLEFIGVIFLSLDSFPSLTNQSPPPRTRAVLPALTTFVFEGVSEYSEDLIARIDTPLLSSFGLQFFYQPIFDIPQVPQFLRCVEKFKPPLTADIYFLDLAVVARFDSPGCDDVFLRFDCTGLARQLLLLERIYAQCLPHTSHVNHLKLNRYNTSESGQQDFALWLEFLRPFNAVRILDVTNVELEADIACVLGGLTAERAAEVLPMLCTVVLHEPEETEPLLRPFIDARKLSDQPVAVS